MKPKDKAKELVDSFMERTKYDGWQYIGELTAIECAKIAVDEIINYIDNLEKEHVYGFGLEYWKEVKNELNKML